MDVIVDLKNRDDDLSNQTDEVGSIDVKLEKIVQFQLMSDRDYIRRRLGLRPLPVYCVPGLRI